MGFFADMLVGAAGGLGDGLTNVAKQRAVEEEAGRARADKAELAQQIAAQRSEDTRYRVDQASQIAELRMALKDGSGTGRSSGGKGSGGNWVTEGLANAGAMTPEQKNDFLARVELQAPEVLPAVAKRLGIPMEEDVQAPSQADAERIAANPRLQRQGATPEMATTRQPVKYDRVASANKLNDFIALVSAKDAKDYAEGLRGSGTFRLAEKAGETIADPVEKANVVQSLSNPGQNTQAALETKQAVAETRAQGGVDQAQIKADAKKSGGAGNTDKNDVANNKLLTAAVKAAAGLVPKLTAIDAMDPKKVAAREVAVQRAINTDSQVLALRSKLKLPAAPAAPPGNRPPLSSFQNK